MALGDLMASRFSQSSAALDEFGNEDGERSNVRDSDTASSSYVGGGVADNAITTTSMAYFPQTIVLCELRHDGFEDAVPSGPSDTGLVSKWRPRDRLVQIWWFEQEIPAFAVSDFCMTALRSERNCQNSDIRLIKRFVIHGEDLFCTGARVLICHHCRRSIFLCKPK